MKVSFIINVFLLFVSFSLLSFFFLGESLFDFFKFFVLFMAFYILFLLLYPHVRGVRKGDEVILDNGLFFFQIRGKALTNARLNQEIKVRLDSGKIILGVVKQYETLFLPAKIKMIYEDNNLQ